MSAMSNGNAKVAPASKAPGGAGPRAVALIGPQGSGKSTLFDALLTAAGSPPRDGPRPAAGPWARKPASHTAH